VSAHSLDSIRSVATITYVSDPTPSGRLCVVVGDGWDPAAPQVQVSLLPDGDSGLPGAELEAAALNWSRAEVVSAAEPPCLTFLLPPGPNGVWAVRALNGDQASKPTLINRACPEWLFTDRAHPRGVVRALGRGMVSLDLYPEKSPDEPTSYGGYVDDHRTQALLRGPQGRFVTAQVLKASSYDVHFRLPDELALGDYEVFLHNGHGGALGWSAPLTLQVAAADPWPTTVFNARDYGAKGDNSADETAAVQSALDAAGASGGGVVLLPPGNYRFLGGLRMPRRTVLRGADRPRVWLYLPQGAGAGWGTPEQGMAITAFIQGDGDFGVADLNILAVYSPLIIAAPVKADLPENPGWNNALDTDRYADNVFVRNCRIVHDATFDYHSRPQDDPLLSQESLVREGRLWHFAAVALRGDHIEITDCDIKGAGMAVVLLGTRYGLIARSTLRLGSFANSYSLHYTDRPWEKIIVEDNTFAIASNINHAASWMSGMGTCAYIARNHMQPIFWVCDCEGLLFHQSEDKLTCQATHAGESSVTLDKASLAALYRRCWDNVGRYLEEDGSLKPDALKGFTAVIAHGRGLGQFRRISGNTVDTFTVDRPWAVRPDAGCTVALLRVAPFIKMRVIDNIIEDGGSGIYFWGSAFDAIIDGNRLYRNHGVNLQDLSSTYRDGGLGYWEFGACYCNQMLHNVVSEGRADAVAGLYGGCRYPELPAVTGVAGFIARGNVVEKDSRLIAQPDKAMPDALNYLGVVFERNLCRDGAVGIQLGEGVEAVLRENTFSNVDCPVKDGGARVTRVND
jgi:hypothetical protein